MKTLEQIKDDYAVSKGYKDWIDILETNREYPYLLSRLIDAVMKIYAMECLKLASERLIWKEDKELLEDITNENNIIK